MKHLKGGLAAPLPSESAKQVPNPKAQVVAGMGWSIGFSPARSIMGQFLAKLGGHVRQAYRRRERAANPRRAATVSGGLKLGCLDKTMRKARRQCS